MDGPIRSKERGKELEVFPKNISMVHVIIASRVLEIF